MSPDATVEAELIGNRAVGVAHLFDYLDGYRRGRIATDVRPDVRRPAPAVIDVEQWLAAFAFGLALSAGALWLLHRLDPGAGRVAEVAVLVVAQGIATVVRFLTLHAMMARREPGAASA